MTVRQCLSGLVSAAVSDVALMAAWYKVQANQGGPGTDRVTVDSFARRLFEHLGTLRAQVQNGTYAPRPLRRASFPREGKTPRILAIPCVRDRVLQSALAHVLTPVLDPQFEESSFAYRIGRSVRMAIEAVVRLRNDGWCWVVDADIHAFFDEIDHDTLLSKLKTACGDDGVVDLVRRWIKNPIRHRDERLVHPLRGIGQGSPLSPLLANLYLDEFDEFIAAKGWRSVRFADDFLILCRKREDAERALELTEEALGSLALRFAPEKTRLTHFSEGFVFLGMRFEDNQIFPESPESAPWLHPAPRVAFTSGSSGLSALGEALSQAGLARASDRAPVPPVVAEKEEEAEAPSAPEEFSVDDQAPPHLRTLYLISPGLTLLRSGERLAVVDSGETLREVPIHTIDQVLAMGHCMLSSAAISLCVENGVGLHILRPTRQLSAHLAPATPSAVALRRAQFRATEDEGFRLKIARVLVVAKIRNSRTVISRFLRHHPLEGSEARLGELEHAVERIASMQSVEQINGCEGNAGRLYFALFRRMLPEGWVFGARLAHPPADSVNALLSYGYAVLFANVASILARRGLDTAFGFLHMPKNGHAALVSDVMEPYRAAVVDATVLTLLFRHRLKPTDFEALPGDTLPTRLSGRAKRVLIHAIEEKLNSRPAGSQQDFRRLLAQDAVNLVAAIESRSDWSPFVL